jgi:hypothetical protein
MGSSIALRKAVSRRMKAIGRRSVDRLITDVLQAIKIVLWCLSPIFAKGLAIVA